jgi:hypothetical protein
MGSHLKILSRRFAKFFKIIDFCDLMHFYLLFAFLEHLAGAIQRKPLMELAIDTTVVCVLI